MTTPETEIESALYAHRWGYGFSKGWSVERCNEHAGQAVEAFRKAHPERSPADGLSTNEREAQAAFRTAKVIVTERAACIADIRAVRAQPRWTDQGLEALDEAIARIEERAGGGT
jgi:hypothetical protein